MFVVMLVIFTGSLQPVTDPDFWWHLKTGQYVVGTKTILAHRHLLELALRERMGHARKMEKMNTSDNHSCGDQN